MPTTSDKSGTWTTQVRNFYFDNETTENIFSHPYISYITNERFQGVEQFHVKLIILCEIKNIFLARTIEN